MTEDEYNRWTAFREKEDSTLPQEDQDLIVEIWNGVFQTGRMKRPGKCCPEPWQEMINDVNDVYATYQPEEGDELQGLVS